jgi:anti-sigma factor RsiW
MSELDRVVAGIRCRDVLADLSDYVDGDLSPERVARLGEHLQGCDHCERFGNEFSSVVTALKGLTSASTDDEASRERMLHRLRAAIGND